MKCNAESRKEQCRILDRRKSVVKNFAENKGNRKSRGFLETYTIFDSLHKIDKRNPGTLTDVNGRVDIILYKTPSNLSI